MPKLSSSVLFAASLSAAVTAQGPASTALPHLELADALAGGGSAAAPSAASGSFALSEATQKLRAELQDTDYSLHTMFQQEHGDFMLRRERFHPMIELSASSLTDAAVQHEQGHFDLFRAKADIELPVMVSTDAYLRFGAFYEGRHYQAQNMGGLFGDEALSSAGMKAGFGWFLDKDILFEALIQPGSWSDWDGTLHHKDFDFPASALFTVRYSDELFWKLGARYNEVFEDANVLPYLGFSFVGESVRVDVLAPEMLEVSLWPSPDFGVLFGAQIQGAEYHVRTGLAQGHQRADVRVQEVLIYTGAQWRMSDNTSFGARVGAAVAGDYKLDDGDPTTKRVTGTLEPSLFLEISFGLDF